LKKSKKAIIIPHLYSFSREVESFVEEEHLVDKRKKKGKSGVFAKNSNVKSFGVILIILSVFLIFFYMAIYENYAPATLAVTTGIFVMTIIVQIVFSKIMGAYTQLKGRKLADKILGFKMYLETTEQKVFDNLNPPDMTLQLFEKYLPFAVALGVENRWAAKFEDKIKQAVEAGTYNPVWYSGSITDLSRSSNFTSTMASGFAGSISSASTPPSSSSGGSSGGGSSGGGGGGGGGGGW
jgi:uncharacterized membrane protein